MTTTVPDSRPQQAPGEWWSKVPQVTAFFWIIKVLATTVGETAADYLNQTLHFGLIGTTAVMGALLAVSLVAQFRSPRYVPGLYWLAIVFISVVGTLITDNLTDNFGVSLWVSSAVFAALLGLTFFGWYRREGTLSIHSIYTRRREGFYWLTILFTFALGTAAGDLVAEQLSLGYLTSVGLVAGLIAVVALAHRFLHLGAVFTFWAAYVLNRPLGASIGDFLSQSRDLGGLGLGTTVTSLIFLGLILLLTGYLTVSRRDQLTASGAA